MDSDEKKRDYVVLALAIVSGYICFYLLNAFSYYSVHSGRYGSFIAFILIFITFCLIAFFAIRPIKTQKGKTILGLTSMIFGSVILLFPFIDLLILVSNATSDQLSGIFRSFTQISFLFITAGALLFWNGISMFRKNYTSGIMNSKTLKKEVQNMNETKIDYGVVALAIIGCYVSLHLLIHSGYSIVYSIGCGSIIALILLFIVFCLIAFFTIRPIKTRKGKTILGLTSTIFGIAILFFPLIDFLILVSNAVTSDQLLDIFISGIPISILFLVAGVMLLLNGISMFRKNYTSGMLRKELQNTNMN
jgi:preprotein translocase subunit YajC